MQETVKSVFSTKLNDFVKTLNAYVGTPDGQWAIKDFIDIDWKIYTILVVPRASRRKTRSK